MTVTEMLNVTEMLKKLNLIKEDSIKTEVEEKFQELTTTDTGFVDTSTAGNFTINSSGITFTGGNVSSGITITSSGVPSTSAGSVNIGTTSTIAGWGNPTATTLTSGYLSYINPEMEEIKKELKDLYKLLAIIYKDLSELKDSIETKEEV